MRSTPLALALALAFALGAVAGCVTPSADKASTAAVDPDTNMPDWVTRALPAGAEHDHNDPAQHANMTTPNFHELGWDALVTDRYKQTAVGMGCGGTGVTKEGRKLALVHTIATEVAFIVADITDPAHPQKLGEYWMPNAVIWDATITPDGKHALVGAYPPGPLFGRNPTLPPIPGASAAAPDANGATPLQIYYHDDCTGETKNAGPEQWFPWGPGIVMIGLQDPKDPKFESWVPQPVIGPHSVTAHLIDGHLYATSSVTNLVHEGSYYSFFEITDTPAGSVLAPLSVIEVPGHPGPTALNGHIDVYLAKHPKTNKVTAWLANWDGMYVYDMSDMRAPKMLSEWHDGKAGSLHTTFPFPTMWGAKHYTLAGQEVGESKDLPSGWVYILDDTDPAHVKEVGRWTLPLKVPWKGANNSGGGLSFSPHYVAVLNTTMFVSMYHAGIWAVDISDPTHPEAVGHFEPDQVSPKPYGGKPSGPSTEDILVDDATGTLTTWGNGSGVYTLWYDEHAPMPKPPRWPFDYPKAS